MPIPSCIIPHSPILVPTFSLPSAISLHSIKRSVLLRSDRMDPLTSLSPIAMLLSVCSPLLYTSGFWVPICPTPNILVCLHREGLSDSSQGCDTRFEHLFPYPCSLSRFPTCRLASLDPVMPLHPYQLSAPLPQSILHPRFYPRSWLSTILVSCGIGPLPSVSLLNYPRLLWRCAPTPWLSLAFLGPWL